LGSLSLPNLISYVHADEASLTVEPTIEHLRGALTVTEVEEDQFFRADGCILADAHSRAEERV